MSHGARRLLDEARRLIDDGERIARGEAASLKAAPDLAAAVRSAARKAYVVLDGTLIAIDRVGMRAKTDRPYYSGKHKRHGLNVQVLTDPAGRLIWTSPALPGSIHDVKAARRHGLVHALTGYDIPVLADRGYQGAAGTIRVPSRRQHGRDLPAGPTAVNTAHARPRAPGERGPATGKPATPAPPALLPPTRHRARRSSTRPRDRHPILRLERAHQGYATHRQSGDGIATWSHLCTCRTYSARDPIVVAARSVTRGGERQTRSGSCG